MKVTFAQIVELRPCYSTDRLSNFFSDCAEIDSAAPSTYEIVRALPKSDARWLLARLLPPAQRILWAQACARRAKEYAAADAAAANDAACAAAYADVASANDAAYAARCAAAGAARYAAYAARCAAAGAAAIDAAIDAEHSLAVRHALALLSQVP